MNGVCKKNTIHRISKNVYIFLKIWYNWFVYTVISLCRLWFAWKKQAWVLGKWQEVDNSESMRICKQFYLSKLSSRCVLNHKPQLNQWQTHKKLAEKITNLI